MYGAMPSVTMPIVFDWELTEAVPRHVLRVVMGVYLGFAGFWIAGAVKPELRVPALYSLAVFMFGIAGGRLFDIAVSGAPHPLMWLYTGLELVLGAAAVKLNRP